MPYFTDYADEDKKKEELDPNSVQLASAGEISGAGGNQQGGLKPTQEVNSGSGFQNLDKYINANQGSQFGSQFLGKAGAGVQKAYDTKNAASDQFKQQVNQANTLPSQEQIQSSVANPEQANPQDYQSWMKQSYSGPNDLAQNQDVWNKYWSGINSAKAPTEQLGSQSGRHSLLDNYFGRPGYNQGEKNLDDLLLQKGNIGKGTRDLKSKVGALKASGQQGVNDLKNFASARAGQVNQSAAHARGAVGVDEKGNVVEGEGQGALGEEYGKVNQSLAEKNASRKASHEGVKQSLQNGSLSPEQLQNLGLSGGEYAYDLDLNNYLSQGKDLNKNHAITPENQSRIKALSSLAGIEDTFASGTPEDPGKDYNFDTGRFNQDSRQSLTNYMNEINAAGDAGFKGAMPQAGPDEIYRATKDYLARFPEEKQLKAGIDRYEAAQNKYKPTRRVKG